MQTKREGKGKGKAKVEENYTVFCFTAETVQLNDLPGMAGMIYSQIHSNNNRTGT